MAAIKRMKDHAVVMAPVWADTVRLDTLKLQRPLSDEVVKYAQVCLAKIDVDTVPLKNAHKVAAGLLVANRGDDVQRMYARLADSITDDSNREFFMRMLNVYMNAVPVQMDKVISLYEMGLLRLPADSVTTSLMLRSVVASVSARSGDYRLANKIAKEILSITDTLSAKYRDDTYNRNAEVMIYPIISMLMPQEAVDSLKVSTPAYRKYLGGIWKSIMGYEPDSDSERSAIGLKAPQPTGHFWYSNLGADGKVKSIDSVELIKKGKVNAIYFAQAGCHSNYKFVVNGRHNGNPSDCWREIFRLRKLQERYPQINVILVSNTFGSFADAPPLEPQQEADTLADYFLNFHKLKATQVVYKTDFIRLAGYDNRRIDSETDNYVAFRLGSYSLAIYNNVVMVDEEGLIFHNGDLGSMGEYMANARIEAVMSRQVNRE